MNEQDKMTRVNDEFERWFSNKLAESSRQQ